MSSEALLLPKDSSFMAFSNVETGTTLPAGSFASISILQLQQSADAAASAAAAAHPDPGAPIIFEIHVRSGSRARQLLPRVEVKRVAYRFSFRRLHVQCRCQRCRRGRSRVQCFKLHQILIVLSLETSNAILNPANIAPI